MAGKRRHKRIIKRLATQFSWEGSTFRGTSSNLSESGLFLRTIKPLPADTQVDISIQLPDDTVTRLRGTVRWSLKSLQSTWRSGMGIEISENDRKYVDFLNAFLPPEEQIVYREQKKAVPAPSAPKSEQAASRESRPAPRRESKPATPPKGPPAAARESDHETDDSEIDSLIFSLFSKREKKEGE
jgi:uncharacterized protein (TIGR02266 family)